MAFSTTKFGHGKVFGKLILSYVGINRLLTHCFLIYVRNAFSDFLIKIFIQTEEIMLTAKANNYGSNIVEFI